MFRRLFPNLAKLDGGKLIGLAILAVFVWIAIAGLTESYFISQDWIHEASR